MTRFESGAVVLVRFPFTDLSSAKKRPAIVLSPESYLSRHGDLVMMPLTSVPQSERSWFLDGWQEAGLLRPTWLKPVLATISQDLVERQIGVLPGSDRQCVRGAVCDALDAEWR
jgi:mRNA interferase MazF